LKLPRDVSGEDVVRSLRRLGYEITRQTGSHIRVTSKRKLRVGTLAGILSDVATYLDLSRDELTEQLFG